jgi:type IV pilus assembly protein PilF
MSARLARLGVACATALLLAACAGGGGGSQRASDNNAAASANLQLGAAYLQAGNLELAKEKLERAAGQAPRNAEVRGMLAMLYQRMGDNPRAEAAFREALQLSPKDPDLLNNYAVYLCSHGKVDGGVTRFEQAAENPLYRTPWAAYTNAGVCLRGAGRAAEARKRFEKAMQVRPDYVEAVRQLVDLDLAEKHAPDALARVQAYLNANPANPDVLLIGWRAATAAQDRLAAVRYAFRLQTEFGDSEQARSVRNAAQAQQP